MRRTKAAPSLPNMITRTATGPDTSWRDRLGLPVPVLLALSLLGAPRVVLHDLDLIQEGTLVNALFVFGPPVIWVAVAVLRRVPHPLWTLLAIGAGYGVFLALGHQLLWHLSFPEPPRLGGNLSGLEPGVQAVIVRAFSALSSLFTGLVVGAITGLIAWGLSALRPGRPSSR